jgi:aryl-alcohol dehydrogenase-like predicted oxidoreductase
MARLAPSLRRPNWLFVLPDAMLSRLGFGTSGIMGAALTTSGRLRLLDAAWDAGIRHFDTAPLYGFGEAESLLGRFLRGRRDSITITTKFGLLPASIHPLARPLIPLARGVNRRLLPPLRRGLKRLAASSGDGAGIQVAAKPAPSQPGGPSLPDSASAEPPTPYTPANLRQQLELSLRKLRCDCIDYYLLHEAQFAYLHPPFLETLDQLVREGKIRHYGIGGERGSSRRVVEHFPQHPWVLQIPDTHTNLDTSWFVEHSAGPLFTHSALRLGRAGSLQELQPLLAPWAALRQRPEEDPALVGELLMALALTRNARGCVIFSSGNRDRIRANAALLQTLSTLDPPAQRWLQANANAVAAALPS